MWWDFNGAAVFRLRKCRLPRRFLRVVNLLQWGRSLSTAEVRGLMWREASRAYFNGAAVFRLRKSLPTSLNTVQATRDFNGAAVFRLRKYSATATECSAFCILQWGRSLSTAEVHRATPFAAARLLT